jgi:hypothetical protein
MMSAMYQLFKTICLYSLWGVNLVLNPVFGEEAVWQTKIDKYNIQVKQLKKNTAFKFQHSKGEVTVNATPSMVFALLNDYEACELWVYNCLSAERINQDLVHMVFRGPLWYKARDLVFSYTVSYLPEKQQWLLKMSSEASKFPNINFVRINTFSASWLFTPINNKKLHLLYEVYVDPEINLTPAVNKYNREAMFTTLRRMRYQLLQAPYKNQLQLADELKKMVLEAEENLKTPEPRS